jgi:ubiquinone biosynthesis protein
MQPLKKILRVARINFTLMRHNLGEIITETHLFRPLRFIVFLNPFYWRKEKEPRGERVRLALQELGPIFVKFGQMLSTRRDILPEDIADALSKLQDDVAPFPGKVAQKMIETALGQPIDTIFKHFDITPLASASIAQVHGATLFTGEEVVIKVLRPKIEETIRSDIELLYFIAKLAERYSNAGRRLKAVQIIAEFEKTLLDELDLVREAANASQLRRNHFGDPTVHIPKVYWKYTKTTVLVLERIHGIPLRRIDLLREKGVPLNAVAKIALHVFFTEVFENSFFHADMHAGNLFVDANSIHKPVLILVDFGIVGTLSRTDQEYLAANLYAFLSRDYRRVAELHIQSGWVPPNTRVDEFECAIRSVCEPIFERPLKEVSLGEMLLRLIQVARRFNMEVLPQLILLQKTLINIEGMCRQIDPDLDIWDTMQPMLEQWMKKHVGPLATFRELQARFPQMSSQLLEIPELLFQSLKRSQHMQIEKMINATTKAEESESSLMNILLFGILNLALFAGVSWFAPRFLETSLSTLLVLGATTFVSWIVFSFKK